MHHPSRELYVFGTDISPATYVTNYLVTAVCFAGIALHVALKPKPRSFTRSSTVGHLVPSAFLLIHLASYGIGYLIAGLQHQIGKYEVCPGIEMPSNVTVPCPSSGENAEGFVRTYLLFIGFAAFQLVPIGIALGGFASAKSFKVIVVVSEVLAIGLAIVGVAAASFTVIGLVMTLMNLFLVVMCAIGRCRDAELSSGKVLALIGALLLVIGALIQFGLTGMCGSAAYRQDGAAKCPFGGDGVTGINHNFVYHVFEILSKFVLVLASRHLVIAADASIEAEMTEMPVAAA